MMLDEEMLSEGLKYVVGEWQVDYVVNAWSNDLAHIPASEFKSEDGNDFSAISFEFFEDHTVILKNSANGKEVSGEWEQKDMLEYRYTLKDFLALPEGAFRENAEKLSVVDGHLAFSVGFLVIAMKKIREGTVTKKPDIGDIEMSEADAADDKLVGRYTPAKAFSVIGGDFRLCTREEVEAEMKRMADAGEEPDGGMLEAFSVTVEIASDHKLYQWMKLPDGISDEEIKAAIEEGEIAAVKDGEFCTGANDWKCLDGKYYYDTKEERELFGEKQSSWEELTLDEDGLLNFGSGMMKLKKI